ncbi:hypothetical protein HBH53_007770 [Parastagonospora nodorum]|nr:hypothetical protein HBH53_007770 [Parastagonospora nodorum]KAH3982043.1 hypothetical protein HBH52_080730 [Parastagonospora nodorum]KAH4821200.1 hypothetical protein HBH61_021520 [Parastagonospora nodorum]KAH5235087.1 hypothetical protein HBI62_037140 [Parastagonospora nodorum]KAH5393680.1 hypothetical protein HBI32_222680 [Parastagonospora nodorum]
MQRCGSTNSINLGDYTAASDRTTTSTLFVPSNLGDAEAQKVQSFIMSKFISCVQTGASQYNHNYKEDRGWLMKGWRCELTALSQLYNLYFIACNDTILVYQPEFPDQNIAPDPPLILHPPVSSPGLEPGIDEDDPHSITRVLVDFLGNDEVLLATCDDGDVVGYRIAEIQRALNELSRPEQDDEPDHAPPQIPLFLHQNVGASAWGLAIHREARIIAISANTHEVTILAFALATTEGESPELDALDSIAATDEADPADFPAPRKHNNFFTLKAAHNVPAVSFNNNDEDPSGRWLFGTCITGQVWLWDIHSYPNIASRCFQMGFCASTQNADTAPRAAFGRCGCLNWSAHPHASWGAMFLDPRSAHEVSSFSEPPESAQRAPFFHDLGRLKGRFRESNREDLVDDATAHGSLDSTSETSGDENTMDEPMLLDSVSDSSHEDEEEEEEEASDDEDEDDDDDDDDEEEEDQDEDSQAYDGPSLPSMQLGSDSHTNHFTWSIQQNLLASGTPGAILAHAMRSMEPIPYCQIATDPSFPCSSSRQPSLVITKDDIFFLQQPFNSSPDPILTIRCPLHPGRATQSLHAIDRQCFSTHVPELGIFIIGSPVGHVAIFALTKSRESGEFGFELEYILPFNKRDENEVLTVPYRRMVGVAVGPVQGELGRDEGKRGRRWRLLMYFMDHSMMSYEVARKRGSEDVGLGELVV